MSDAELGDLIRQIKQEFRRRENEAEKDFRVNEQREWKDLALSADKLGEDYYGYLWRR